MDSAIRRSNGIANKAYARDQDQEGEDDAQYYSTDEPCSSDQSSNTPPRELSQMQFVNFARTAESDRTQYLKHRYPDACIPPHQQIFTRPAIVVQAGKKSYGNSEVLVNLNMNVPEKSIYGLVGSSGCGKTTLLSCIVGLRKLTSGNIFICGEVPGNPASGVPGKRVGYMPQEVALNGEFTFKEVCHYFGQIYGMEKTEIDDRIHYLAELLDLKRLRGQLKDMSGGQQRRVSFAIALLHEPEILILDEPTVGVDPILRQNIWKHLREIVENTGTTVIITTHYIEEMRYADTVAIMRKGELMAENSPAKLLEEHKTTILEDVVLKYCAKIATPGKSKLNGAQQRYSGGVEESDVRQPRPRQAIMAYNDWRHGPPVRSVKPEDIQTKSFNRMKALIRKNLLVLLRNILLLLVTFVSPAAVVSICCYGLGSHPVGLELGVINRDVADSYVCNPGFDSCQPDHLSCRFLDILNRVDSIKLVSIKDEAEALKKVELRKLWGYIEFPKGFSESLLAKTLGKTPSILNNQTLDSQIQVKLDLTSLEVGLTLKKLVLETYSQFSKNLLSACEVDTTGRGFPLQFKEPFYGWDDAPATNSIALGFAIGFLFFMASLTCGLTYILEKKDGMLSRTMVTGVTTMEILMSYFLTQFLVVIVQGILVFLLLFLGFDIPRLGSPVLAFLIMMLASVSGMSLGFLGGTVCDDEKSAVFVAISAIMPNFMLSGWIWPVEGLPPTLYYVSYLLPSTLPAETLRSILLRGWGMSHFTVWIGFVAAIGWTAFYWIAVIVIYKVRAIRS